MTIEADAKKPLNEEEISRFFLRDGLRMLNRLITSYQAVTGEISNAGYIEPLGTSDLQLYAMFTVDGRNIRDRWPGHSQNTFPLPEPYTNRILRGMLVGRAGPDSLFYANALVLINRGQYSLAVAQASAAIEIRITSFVTAKLRQGGRSKSYVNRYRKQPLGPKVRHKHPDERSLETYCQGVPRFRLLLRRLRTSLVPLRNRVIHEGHLASLDEAQRAIRYMEEVFRALPK